MRFYGVAQLLICEYPVSVLATDFLPLNKPALFQIVNDPLDGPLGNANVKGYLTQHQLRISMKDGQYVGVIG